SRTGVGNHRVAAAALGFVGEVEFCATALPGVPDKVLAIAGENQRGVVGKPLPHPFVVLVVDAAGNALEGISVTFEVTQGGGSVGGGTSLTVNTDDDGRTATVLTLGPQEGLNNNVVTATFPGLSGLPATFVASGVIPGLPQDTRVSGVVLDNSNVPIPGATARIKGTALQTTTDDQGQFTLTGVPVGTIFLVVDGSTSPRLETFPALEFELVTVAEQDNTVGMPILIPALDTQNSQICGGSQSCTLAMAGVPGMALTILPNSVTFADGSREGRVLFTQVHLDKVPMPPPDGSVFVPAWTIQPAGVHFDPPARVTIPNTAGLPPGEQAEIFQFDHDLGAFISVGPGTVSEDGSVVVSDPGFGITKAGWGGVRIPPPPPTCVTRPTLDIVGSPSLAFFTIPPPKLLGVNLNTGCLMDRLFKWDSSDPSIISVSPTISERPIVTPIPGILIGEVLIRV
ncbi:MAG: carboxypeptidase-like regulatory domain-containing protein, partial [Nitrospira sp.]|nr:carboxypeptidase-like regulatory domain-containing protein [Nitrospira sp.]